MHQSYLRQPAIERLPNLIEELRVGALRIPPFQRDFVWSAAQRLQLLDSIRIGLPIGSIMVWRTVRGLAFERSIGPYRLEVDRSRKGSGAVIQYLLDGRQRMTTAFSALAGGLWTRNEVLAPRDDALAPDEYPWNVWYDLQAERFALDSGAGESPHLPLDIVLDDFGFDEWLSRHGVSRERYARARALKAAFHDYLVPVVPLVTEDIHVVTLTFKRVNSGGTQMGDVDMARALAWTENFDLRDELEAISEHLAPMGWGTLDAEVSLKAMAGVCDLEPGDFDIEALANRVRSDRGPLEETSMRLAQAVRLFNGLGIRGPRSLPYMYALVFVARAYHQSGYQCDRMDPILAAWVAEVCITERFAVSTPDVLRAMWRELVDRLGLGKKSPIVAKRRDAKECRRYSFAWARSRLTAIVLARSGPRASDGSMVREPEQLVATYGNDATPMLFSTRMEGVPPSLVLALGASLQAAALRSPANRVVCKPEDGELLRRALLDPNASADLLASHLIDPAAARDLRVGNVTGFLEKRRKAILAAERSWLEGCGVANVTIKDGGPLWREPS